MDAALRDVTRALGSWLDAGRPAVLATVVASDSSAPRGLGARLAIAGATEWVGALSGGCTEAAVIEQAELLLTRGEPDAAVLVTYAKETLTDVGPICGATLTVLVERVDDVLVGTLERLVDRAGSGEASTLRVTYIPAEGAAGALARDAVELDEREPADRRSVDLQLGSSETVLAETVPPAPQLVIGGAGDIAGELIRLAERLAWRTTLLDAREVLLQQTLRACTPTRSICAWPDAAWPELDVDARTACIALAHEAHHDEPFLQQALASDAKYVGAVGSRRAQLARRVALLELGVPQASIDRLRGPAGLDLGGRSAAEIALAIFAEIVAVANGRAGGPLVAADGPIQSS